MKKQIPSSSTKPPEKVSRWKEKLEKAYKEEIKSLETSLKFSEKVEPETHDQIFFEDTRDQSEKDFHLEQTKKRSQIRIEQGRSTCFDNLLQASMIYSKEIDYTSPDLPIELQKPYLYLEQAPPCDLENIKLAILLHLKLEKNKHKREYWESLLCICESIIQPQASIFTDEIHKILIDKDINGLNKLKSQILQNIDNPTLDKSYWQEVLGKIDVYKARLALENCCEEYLDGRKEKSVSVVSSNNLCIKSYFFRNERPKVNLGDGSNSPVLVQEIPDDFELITPQQDKSSYSLTRTTILNKEIALLKKSQSRLSINSNLFLKFDNKLLDISSAEKIVNGNLELSMDDLMRIDLMKKNPVESDEKELNEVVNIKPVLEDWMKKYKPRKPKFFNRIKTGYEWTRHNQTHYDHKNTPPKVVQGYKFNIFYPYLIDKTKAPQFYLEPNEDNETCTIRFHAGPPYEDIAFKILNREWDFSDRNGFKSFYDKGVLHLYFNFKRHRYKR
jgi:Cactus-binding C-terminus of cactin protein/Conserved mid region of cactin